MEQTEEMIMLLNRMPNPAFFVSGGRITHANPSALSRLIAVGDAVGEMLVTGAQEYAEFQGGCLYLTLRICGVPCEASVTRMGGFDCFVLEQEADQAELQAMALAARELRGPLSTVMTVADRLFPLTGTDDSPETQNQVSRINRGLFQMLRIVSNMSDAYRYSQDTAPRLEIRDVCGILEELFREIAPLIRCAGAELRYTVPAETVYCLVDEEKLERGIHNILSNALKFTPKGGTIDARVVRRGSMLFLTVRNDGTGEGLSGSFYRDFRRAPGIEEGRFGIGLGMVLIRSAATAHGGTVLLEQNAELGTRITMSIAIRQNGDASVRASVLHVDYAGERDHRLLELSDSLPLSLYRSENIN